MQPLVLLLTLLLATSPLAQPQPEVPQDGPAPFEQDAFYPLLHNVLSWGDSPAASAPPVDLAHIRQHPADARGEVFLLEGQFAGRPRKIPLSQPGPWGDNLTEWVLVLDDNPSNVAVVYLVNPQNPFNPPRVGQRVRIPARFFNLWLDRDANNQPTTYPTFVGRSPQFITQQQQGSSQALAAPILLAFLALAYLFWRLRRSIKRPLPRAAIRASSPTPEPTRTEDLPTDPAEALAELHRRARH